MIHPCCLTVAGSDSGGNAGIQADLRAFHSYGVHGCTVFAALTAQNPEAVSAVMPVPPGFVRAQLQAVLSMYSVKAMKTGMLPDPKTIGVVVEETRKFPRMKKVIDPVMVATSGTRLVSKKAVKAIRELLVPIATLITPNLPEAEVLLDREISDIADVPDAARELSREFGCAVLVKGGHAVERNAAKRLVDSSARDVLCVNGRITEYSMPVVEHPVSTHGTGCTFAAAIAAGLALGMPLPMAVKRAKAHVHSAISNACLVGRRCGVLGFVKEMN